MHPRYEVEREYAVRIIGKLAEEHLKQLKKGIRLEDGMARFDVIEERGGRGLNNWYRVVLREGRNRIVRRMFDAAGFRVSRLMRVRFGIVSLPFGLRRGTWREVDETQTSAIVDWSTTLLNAPEIEQPVPQRSTFQRPTLQFAAGERTTSECSACELRTSARPASQFQSGERSALHPDAQRGEGGGCQPGSWRRSSRKTWSDPAPVSSQVNSSCG